MTETNNKCDIKIDVKNDNSEPSIEVTYGESSWHNSLPFSSCNSIWDSCVNEGRKTREKGRGEGKKGGREGERLEALLSPVSSH